MTTKTPTIPKRYQAWIETLREAGREVEVTFDRVTPDESVLHVWAPASRWYDSNISFGVSVPDKGRSRFLGLTVFTATGPTLGLRTKSVSRAAIRLDVYTMSERQDYR